VIGEIMDRDEKVTKVEKGGLDAGDVLRLSPRELFEDLLGEPEERGYDGKMLKEISEKARFFACERLSSPERDGEKE